MDIAEAAKAVTEALAPFMPLLFRVGEHAAEEAGNRIGAADGAPRSSCGSMSGAVQATIQRLSEQPVT